MLREDRLWLGMVSALLVAFVGYAITLLFYDLLADAELVLASNKDSVFRLRTVAVIAICFTVLPLQFFQKKRMTKAMRGVMITTAILAVTWLIKFGPDLFQVG